MRLVNATITVQTSPSGGPVSFTYRGRKYRVTAIVDHWRYTGRWWLGEGSWVLWRVEATGLFELLYDEDAAEWRLYRIYD